MTEQELLPIFSELIRTYRLKGAYERYTTIKTGNINDTYVLHTRLSDGSERQYAVQRINHNVFRDPDAVAQNAYAVTEHIERKKRAAGDTDLRRHVLRFYRMEDGKFFLRRADGSYWRVLSYVYDALNTSRADERILYGTGVAFGQFQRDLADFPADQLQITIPDFHNTPKRFADLKESIKRDACGRASEVKEEIDWLLSMEERVFLYERLHTEGKLPVRVVHNDTKCNNVMFDSQTLEPLTVIDLDTVMPGFVGHDFGDAVRFACNTAAEDEPDIAKVALDLNGFAHFAAGFLAPLQGVLTQTELDTLPDGVLLITLELASRFLTDYLNGDVYFKCAHAKQNLQRTRCQIALAKDILRQLSEMHHLLSKIVNFGQDKNSNP